MQKFTPVGELKKTHEALHLTVSGWGLGELVIAAGDVPKLLSGHEATVHFVQRRGDEVFIGFAGTARPSRSGRAINVRIESRLMTVPRKAVEAVVSGKRATARVSAPAPIIDADKEQRKAIDHDLVRSFS